MALDLDSLVFSVDTSALDQAVTKVTALQEAVSKLNTPVKQAAIDSEKLAQAQAKTAKATADAAAATAKAEVAQSKLGKATKEVGESTKVNTSVLERQQKILEFMTQGFSKGQSSVLAYATAAGAATTEIKQLGEVLQVQRKLVGGDPFDKSTSGLIALTNKLGEAKEANRLYTAGIELTKSQTRDLARDKERIIEAMKVEGASLTDIKEKLREHNAAYIKVADSINRLDVAEKEKIKTDRSHVNAKQALIKEDQRVLDVLSSMSGAQGVNKASTERSAAAIAKYAATLRTAGVAGTDFTAKLDAYKRKMIEVAAIEEKAKVSYVTRAVGPQLTDIFSGLATGQQSLYTIMVQQGGQLADQFALAGIEAGKMGSVLANALPQMFNNIKSIGAALGEMLIGGLKLAAAKTFELAGAWTGLSARFEAAKASLVAVAMDGGSAFSGLAATILRASAGLGTFAIALAATGIGALIIALGTMAVAFKQVYTEQSELNKAMALNGGQIGMTQQKAYDLAASISAAGGSTRSYLEAITESGKASNITADNLETVIQAAVRMKSKAGVAIEETIKQFDELAKSPTEALTKLAISLGTIDPEIVRVVNSLEQQGKEAEAAAIATRAYADATEGVADTIKNNMGVLETLFSTIGSAAKKMWDNILGIGRPDKAGTNLENLKSKLKSLQEEGSPTFLGLRTLSPEGVQFQIKMTQMAIDAIEKQDKAEKASADQKVRNSVLVNLDKETLALTDKYIQKTDKKADAIARVNNVYDKSIQANIGNESRILELEQERLKVLAGVEEKFKVKAKVDPSVEYFNDLLKEANKSAIHAADATDVLTKSQERMLALMDEKKFLKLSKDQQSEVLASFAQAAANEQEERSLKELKKAEDARVAAIGKINDELNKLSENHSQTISFVKLLDEEFMQGNITFDQYIKKLNEYSATLAKINSDKQLADNKAMLKSIEDKGTLLKEESADLLLQKTIYGQLSTDQKKQIEYSKIERDTKKEILEVEAKLQEFKTKNSSNRDAIQAQERATEEAKTIIYQNAAIKRQNIQQAIDLETFKTYQDGFAAAIETALFDGGKAGAKSLRSFIIAELRKPITVVINAMVNAALSGVTGQAGGAAAGGAISSTLGSLFGAGGASGAMMAGAGWMTGATTLGGSLSAATSLLTSGVSGILPGLGMLAGALGPIALGLSFLSSMDDSGTYHTGGAGGYSKATGSTKVSTDTLGFHLSDRDVSQTTVKASQDIAKSIVGLLDSTASTFGKEAGYYAAIAFADDTSKDGAWGSLLVKLGDKVIADWSVGREGQIPKEFADGQQGVTDYQNALAKSTLDTLKQIDLPSWVTNVLDSIGTDPSMEQLQQAMDYINSLPANILGNIGTSMDELSGIILTGMQNGDPIGAGQAFADQITYGIENSLYQGFAQQITSIISTQLVTPVLTAMQTGATLTEAMSQASIDTMIEQVSRASEVFAALVNNPAFRAGMEEMNRVIAGAVGGSFTSNMVAPTAPATYGELAKEVTNATDAAKEASDTLKQIESERYGLETQLLTLQGKTAELRARELEKLDPSNRKLQQRIWMLEDEKTATEKANAAFKKSVDDMIALIKFIEDAARTATDKAYAALQRAVEKEKTKIAEQIKDTENAITAAEKSKDTIQSIFDMLTEQVKTLYGEVDSTSKQQAAIGRALIQNAISSGIIPEQKDLESAINAVKSGIDKTVFATKVDADRARLQFAFEVGQLTNTAEDQLTADEKSLVVLKEQLTEQQNQVIKLDSILTEYATQMDLLRDGATLKTVEQAITDLAVALGIEAGVKQKIESQFVRGSGSALYDIKAGAGTNSKGEMFGGSLVAKEALAALDAGTTAQSIYYAIQGSGYTLEQAETILGATPGSFAQEAAKMGLPAFDVGTNYVPRDMIAQIHEGEMIVPRAYNPNANPSMSTDKSADQLELLRYEVRAIAINTSKLERLIDRVIVPTTSGEALQTTAVVA